MLLSGPASEPLAFHAYCGRVRASNGLLLGSPCRMLTFFWNGASLSGDDLIVPAVFVAADEKIGVVIPQAVADRQLHCSGLRLLGDVSKHANLIAWAAERACKPERIRCVKLGDTVANRIWLKDEDFRPISSQDQISGIEP